MSPKKPDIRCNLKRVFALLLPRQTTWSAFLVLLTLAQVAHSQITLADFADFQVIQRDIGGRSKRVIVKFSTSGPAKDSVQARVLRHAGSEVVENWTTISQRTGTGADSGSLVVGQGLLC